jgi:hypothetical protein
MKRIGAAFLAIGAVMALMTIASANAANASPAVTCINRVLFQNSVNNGTGGFFHNNSTSPFTLQILAAVDRQATEYCLEPQSGTGHDRQIEQLGTSRCLQLDTSNRTITEGNCAGAAAQWQFIGVAGPNNETAVEIQSLDNLACIYQNRLNGPATFNPCNRNTTGDVWIEAITSS